MAINTGTHDISTLLATRLTSAAEFGLDTIAKILQADLAAWQVTVLEMVSGLCEVTTDRQRKYGTSVSGQMAEVDEYGKAPTQKAKPGATVGFPLRKFQFNLGWTADFMLQATPADLATMQLNAQKAHWVEVQRQLKKAIYGSANYTYNDHLVDNVDLAVKRFVNADGASIPEGPNGETFDGSTHTHYDANNGWDATVLTASINDVIEHGHGGSVYVAINKADEAAVRLLTGFVGYPDPRLAVPVYSAAGVPAQRLDISRLDNRAIGIFAGAEVWVKSWVIDNYPFIWDAADPNKPLVFRQQSVGALQGLRLAASIPDHPLYVDFMEAYFGVGVWTRTNGAVLYVGGGAWADPTIA
jgi:hypothetical protein